MEQRHDERGPAGERQPDYAGLQVVAADNALPEAVPAAYNWKHEGAYAQVPLTQFKAEGAPELDLSNAAHEAHVSPAIAPPPDRPWWRRKRWVLAAVGALLVIIAVVVGAVVGTRSSSSSSSSSQDPPSSPSSSGNAPNSSSTQRSVCRDTLCPQILAAAALDTSLLVFARGTDNAIWYSSTSLSSSSFRTFQPLGGGPFLGQPAALAWRSSTDNTARVSVLALSDPDRGVRAKTFASPSPPGNWEDLGGPVGGPVAVCLVNGTRPDLWSASDTGVLHNFGTGNTTVDSFWARARGVPWQSSAEFGTRVMLGRPGVVCRQNAYFHDLVVYGEDDKAVRHSTFSLETLWTRATNRGGKFQGEPVVVAVGADRFDFFGVGEDRKMYHFAWTSSGGYTTLEDLGGEFESAPSAAVTGERIDVVALGTNDMLHHRVLRGFKWVSEWEDLGIFGNSAPLLLNITSVQPERIGVFVVGVGGEVNHTVWTVSSDLSWKNLGWTSIGGNVTTEFLS